MTTAPCPIPPIPPDRARILPLAEYMAPFARSLTVPNASNLASIVGAWFTEASLLIDEAIKGQAAISGLSPDIMAPDGEGKEASLRLRLIAVSTPTDLTCVDMRTTSGVTETIDQALQSVAEDLDPMISIYSEAQRLELRAMQRTLTAPVNLLFRLPCGHIAAQAISLPMISVQSIAEAALTAYVIHDANVYANEADPTRRPFSAGIPPLAEGSNAIAAILEPDALCVLRSHQDIEEAVASISKTGRFPGNADLIAVDRSLPNFASLNAAFKVAIGAEPRTHAPGSAHDIATMAPAGGQRLH